MLVLRRPRVLLAASLIVLFLVGYALSNLTAAGQAWENGLLRAHDAFGMPAGWIDTSLVPPFHLDIGTVVVGTLLAVAIAVGRRRWRAAVVVAVATPGAVVATAVFKAVAGRPDLTGATLDTAVSYPSGHAAIAFAVTAAILTVVPRRRLAWCAPMLVGWSVLVAATLQAIGDHRPSEVLGSGLLVPAVFLLVGAVAGLRVAPIRAVQLLDPRRGRIVTAVLVAVALICAWNTLPWAIALYAVVALVSAGLVGWTALSLGREPEPAGVLEPSVAEAVPTR